MKLVLGWTITMGWWTLAELNRLLISAQFRKRNFSPDASTKHFTLQTNDGSLSFQLKWWRKLSNM